MILFCKDFISHTLHGVQSLQCLFMCFWDRQTCPAPDSDHSEAHAQKMNDQLKCEEAVYQLEYMKIKGHQLSKIIFSRAWGCFSSFGQALENQSILFFWSERYSNFFYYLIPHYDEGVSLHPENLPSCSFSVNINLLCTVFCLPWLFIFSFLIFYFYYHNPFFLLLLSLLFSPLFFLILWFYSHSTKCIVDIKYKFPINKCCITWSAVTAHIYWAFTICQLWAKLLQCIISPSLPSCHVRSLGELGLGWGKQDTQGMRLRGAHSQRLTSAASTPENPSVFPALVITIISIFFFRGSNAF